MVGLRIPGLPEGSIQAMYRPSKLQETMILSTGMDPVQRPYVESYHFMTPGPIDLSLLDEILHDLAGRHSTLRSIFCWDPDDRTGDVTLAILDPEYVRRHGGFLSAPADGEAHEQQHRVTFDIYGSSNETKWSGGMLWRVSVSPLPHTRGCRLTLSYHHAVMDGTSARQLLNWIRREIDRPGSAKETSDIMSVQGELDLWRAPDVQARLRHRYERAQPEIMTTPPVSLEDGAPRNEKGQAILRRQIPALLDPNPGSGAVPAWMGRLALALALCVFQGTREALFFETMSARRHLPPESSQVLGLILTTQPRQAQFMGHTSLAQIAQSLKSTEDIRHNFTTGELRSMIPSLGCRIPVAFACQTDQSYPWNGVGDWEWGGRDTLIDMPVFLELMPAHQGCFTVHLHFHRNRFARRTMALFHNFICETLHWLQQVHTELEQYTFRQSVDQIRARDSDIDHYLHTIGMGPTGDHYPVDLSDIEANIVRHPGVKACGVIKGESSSGDLLLAMIETDPFQPHDWTQMIVELQAQMSKSLPSHLIPSHLVQIAGGLATTGSGKLHWQQLASPAAISSPTATDIPSTPSSGKEEEAQLQYWTSQLKDSRPAEFLHDWPRPVTSSGQTLIKKELIQAPRDDALQEFCRTFDVTPLAVLFACFRATHYRMTGVNDANIGTPIPGSESTENLQCLRMQIDDSDTFENLVRGVQSTIEQASCNSDIVLQGISSELERTSDNPLLRVAITMHSQQANKKSGYPENSHPANLDLQLHIYQGENQTNVTVHADLDLYTSPTIDTILSVFSQLLERGLQDPQAPIALLPLTHGCTVLRETGLRQVHGNYPRDSSIVDVFRQQVSSHPDIVAVTDSSRQLTYAELDRESENLAHWLRTRNLAPESVISVFAPRSSETIVAIVGILKANLAYIPMDHRWPDSRVETILSSINSPRLLLLGTNMRSPDVTVEDLEIVPLDQAIRSGSCLTDLPVPQLPSPTSLAYIIFTSGSTGKPKGVMIEHRSVVCRMHSSTNISANGTGKPVAHMASLAFDASIWEIYTALLSGGTVVCIDNATVLDYPLLDEVFARESVRVAFITPALLKELLIASPVSVGRLDSLIVGGDRTDPQSMLHAARLIGSGEVLNGYGPTENTCFSTSYRMPRELPTALNEVPIGQAIPESGAYVMDPQQRLMPAGVLGELVVTGDGLARGYTDDRLNKDRFITVNIEGHSVRAYRTGDHSRYRPRDGLIECFGRMDHQVKLRGFRIELAEIEHVLKDQPGVDEAVVVLQQLQDGHDQQLAAFVTEQQLQANGSEGNSMIEKAHEELWTTMFGTDTYPDSIRVIPPRDGKERTLFRSPSDYNGRLAQEFTNTPMQNNSSLTERLRNQLQAQLPSYMVPTTITVLDHMPINHNGKVDRQALKEMKVSDPSEGSLSPDQVPRNHIEEVICQEFSQVLACPVGVTDSFYGLGGHSLMATRAIFQIARRLQCALSIRDLIDSPTPESLALHIASMNPQNAESREQENTDLTSLPALQMRGWQLAARAVGIDGSDITQVLPCSAFQEGVLSADVAFGGSSSYLGTVYLNTDSSINVEALRSAWTALVSKEEMLRTIFFPVVQKSPRHGICGDTFLQAILKPDSDEVRRVSSIEGAASLEITLSSNVPVVLAFDESSKLVLKIHHALYDGAYISSLLKRLSEAYLSRASQTPRALGLDSGHIPFSTFIRKLQSQEPSEAESFWKSYLGGAPCASWPRSAPSEPCRREERRHQVETVSWKGDARLLARRFHTTPAAIARAAVAMLIAAHSETTDVVLGEVSTGRQPSGFVAGPCITTHPVRIHMTEEMSFNEVVRIATESYAHTMPHQQFGLAAIRRQSEHPGELPFRVLYVYQHGSKSPCDPDHLSDATLPLSGRAENIIQVEFPLVIEAFCSETTGRMDFQFTFDPTALPPQDAYWVRQQLVQVLHAMNTTADPQRPQRPARPLLSAEERDFLTQLPTDATPSQNSSSSLQCAHEIIQDQARKTPEKIALQFEHTRFVTYRELDNWSTDLSHAIRSVLDAESDKRAFRHGQPLVPICFDKSIEMVVTILAVLKAGAAYVPLDIEHPVERLTTICKAIDARLIIWDGVHGHNVLQDVCGEIGCSLLTTDDLQGLDYHDAQHQTTLTQSPSTLAYVLFTSGSTGTPKGVMVEHRNLTSFMRAHAGSTDCSWTSRRLAMLAYTFDASVGDIFGTLGKGGRLCLVRRRLLMLQLSNWLDSLSVSHLALTPTLGEFLLNDHTPEFALPHLTTLVFGGESFRREILHHLPQEMTVWNGYGPTETAVEVTASLVQSPDAPPTLEAPFVSIGQPIHQNQVYLLHPGTAEQVPIGVAGEVCIAGPQVSRGYLNDTDLTSKYFFRNPFSSTGLMYRTGDRARWHGDGTLEYLGRLDGQIKIRGLRIEPSEIAAAAQAHPLVKACAVTKVHSLKSEALVALVQIDAETTQQPTVLTGQIQEYITARVPEYMIPAQVQLCTAPFPQTSSGKIDYRAVTRMAEEGYNRPTEPASITRATPGSLEAQIARHWADVLGIVDEGEQMDITTPFSQLGGDSIRAISLLAALRRDGLPLHMTDLRQSATIQSQTTKVRDSKKIVSDKNVSRGSQLPEYMHLYQRSTSIATIVLIHPFLAQSKTLEALIPFLDARFNVILVDDPFFGTSECPESVTAWARSYLDDIRFPSGHQLILGGYSFGGLIALEMATLWQERTSRSPASVVLLDPGTYSPTSLESTNEEEALSLLGIEQRAMASFQEHFSRHNLVLAQTCLPPVYHGRCLYVGLPTRRHDGVAEFWKRQCPGLTMHYVDCDDHYGLLKEPTLPSVGQVLNQHCCLSVATVDVSCWTAPVSTSEEKMELGRERPVSIPTVVQAYEL